MKFWGKLSDTEKGAILLADQEGKGIELFYDGEWVSCSWPIWNPSKAYRAKPELKTHTYNQWCSPHNSTDGYASLLFSQTTRSTKGRTTITYDGKKPIKLTWEAYE